MPKKNICILIMLAIFNQVVFSMSIRLESLYIYNYTDEEIVVNVVFQDGVITHRGGALDPRNPNHGYVEVGGVGISIRNEIGSGSKHVVRLRPNRYLNVIEYYPFGKSNLDLKRDPYDQLDQVPFMEKMNTIFKKLEIVSEYGTITLDNLGDFLVKKVDSGGGRGYDLEISYQTLNGFDIGYKPGLEW